MENKSIVRERLSFPWCKARLSQARLSPAFLPDRCCAPGWTTPQLLTFGRLDASLQRCQDFFSSDISIISGIMEVKMVWRCQDKSFRPFLGLALLEGSMFFPGKHGWEHYCGKWPDAGAETALSWTQYAASATGQASHVAILLFKISKLEGIWHMSGKNGRIFVSGLYIFVLMRHLWWKPMKEGDCEMPIELEFRPSSTSLASRCQRQNRCLSKTSIFF